MTHSSSGLPFVTRLRLGALASVIEPTGVGIFDTAPDTKNARIAVNYVVEIIGGPQVRNATRAEMGRPSISSAGRFSARGGNPMSGSPSLGGSVKAK